MPHQPIEDAHRAAMNALAEVIDEALNPGKERKVGFTLLVFSFDGPAPRGAFPRMNYISNADRADMIVAMKELIANFEGRGPDSLGEGRA